MPQVIAGLLAFRNGLPLQTGCKGDRAEPAVIIPIVESLPKLIPFGSLWLSLTQTVHNQCFSLVTSGPWLVGCLPLAVEYYVSFIGGILGESVTQCFDHCAYSIVYSKFSDECRNVSFHCCLTDVEPSGDLLVR